MSDTHAPLSSSDTATLYAEEMRRRDDMCDDIYVWIAGPFKGEMPVVAETTFRQMLNESDLRYEHNLTAVAEMAAASSDESKARWVDLYESKREAIRQRLRPMFYRWRAQQSLPKKYQHEIDRAKLFNADAHDAVMKHDLNSGRGLYIYGASQRGKTRAALALLCEFSSLFSSIPFVCENAVELKKIATTENLCERFGEFNALFIDDLGKASLTLAYREQLWELLEFRTANELPTIVTAQCDAAGLQHTLSGWGDDKSDDAEAIVLRVSDHEYCDTVCFD